MDSNFSDFLHQIPIGFLFAPVIFGGLYIAIMIYIFRRAAARRRARVLAMDGSQAVQSQTPGRDDKPLSFFPNRPSNIPISAPPLNLLPEPDLESLSSTAPLLATPDMDYNPITTTMPTTNWLAVTSSNADAAESRALEIINSESKELSMEPSKLADPTGAVEVMRVWRDLSDGTLLIELDGRRFHSPREIGSAELARRFINVVRELWTMVNTGMPSRASDSVATADLTPGSAGSMGTSRGRTGLLNNPPPMPEPDLKAPGMLRTIGRTVTGQPEAHPAGIAHAVEDYLQFKLSNTPQFQQRSIHVRPSFDGSVRIEVDGRSYNGVGDVIDPDVRDFLSATLREWEARQ